jgi:phosphatidylserine decarboxylase
MASTSTENCVSRLLHLYTTLLTITAVVALLRWQRARSRRAIALTPDDVEKDTTNSHNEKQLTASPWTPPQEISHPSWLTDLIKDADADVRPLNNALVELKEIIENDSVLYMLFSLMFQEVPRKPPYNRDPTGSKQIQDYHHMLRVFNHAMTRGPSWMYSTPGQQGLIGFPFSAVLDWPMATVSYLLSYSAFSLHEKLVEVLSSGQTVNSIKFASPAQIIWTNMWNQAAGTVAFIHPKINEAFKNVLNEWARYLESPGSVHVLGTDNRGWLCPEALKSMAKVASDGASSPKPFSSYYICDPSQPHHGFISWDNFFTRQFRPGVRPVASPNDESIIVSSCESSPLRIRRQVAHRDTFWLKSQPYSLVDMLAQDPLAAEFTGGTIYQAFLSALSYHRWHSPVSGRVVKIHHQPGTYYAENYWEGFGARRRPVPDPSRGPHAAGEHKHQPPEADPSGPNKSQGFISEIAARGIIYIDADNPAIGLIAIVYIGIAEVSSVNFAVSPGQHVQKGEQLGMFRYGGSSYCLLFRDGVELEFSEDADPEKRARRYNDVNIRVNSELARLR